jgi:hypothetical protein
MSYTNLNNPANYQLQSFGQDGMRTISTTQAYVEGEYYRVLVATEDSTLSATSMVGDDLASIDVYAGTTIYGLFTAVTVTAGEVTAYLAGRTDIDDVWAYIRAYGVAGGATIEGEDCAKAAISPLLDKYYAKASLVMVPSLYKTSIVYSERPLSTDGELTFTRASSATRVGPDGLIEKVRTNLLLQSEAFNTTWSTYTGTTVTANAVSAPNGTLTADRIEGTSAAARGVYQSISTSAIPHTFSVYLKSATGSSTTCRIWVDSFASIITVTNDWQRFSVTGITAAGFGQFTITSAASSAIDVYAWGAQVETGDIATDYIATTTAAVSVGPVSGLPRLDYLNSSCPRLLLEPQRTNSLGYSQNFDNAYFTKGNSSISANVAISPSGYQDADKLVPDTSNSSHSVYRSVQPIAGGIYSVFAKADGYDWILLTSHSSSAPTSRGAFFNVSDGTIGNTAAGVNAKIEDYGNGWYRCSISEGSSPSSIWTVIATNADNVLSFEGNGTHGVLIWGGQNEQGAYATSYIPTLGAAVTRLAESTSRSGLGLTNSTFVLNFQILSYVAELFDFTKTGGGRMFYIAVQSNGFVTFNSVSGGSIGAIGTAIAINTSHKIAFTLNASTSNVSVFINGVKIGTYATDITTFGAFSGLQTFGYVPASKVEQILIFPSVLTDADCIALTA